MIKFKYIGAATLAACLGLTSTANAQDQESGENNKTIAFGGFGTFTSFNLDGSAYNVGIYSRNQNGLDFRLELLSTTIPYGSSETRLSFLEASASQFLIKNGPFNAGIHGGVLSVDYELEYPSVIYVSRQTGLSYGVEGYYDLPNNLGSIFGRYTAPAYEQTLPYFNYFYDVGAAVAVPINDVDVSARVTYRVFENEDTALIFGLQLNDL